MLHAFPSAKQDFEKSQYKVKKKYLLILNQLKKQDKGDFFTLPPLPPIVYVE